MITTLVWPCSMVSFVFLSCRLQCCQFACWFVLLTIHRMMCVRCRSLSFVTRVMLRCAFVIHVTLHCTFMVFHNRFDAIRYALVVVWNPGTICVLIASCVNRYITSMHYSKCLCTLCFLCVNPVFHVWMYSTLCSVYTFVICTLCCIALCVCVCLWFLMTTTGIVACSRDVITHRFLPLSLSNLCI